MLGKRAFLYRFEDARELTGRNKRRVQTSNRPSDFLLTLDGVTAYWEIKATADARGFSTSDIRVGQRGAAIQQLAAGGCYTFGIRALHPGQQCWFVVPAQFLVPLTGRVPFASLAAFKRSNPVG